MGLGHDENGSSQSTPRYNEDDTLALRNWFDSLSWQDPRYDNKVLLKLAALATSSDEMRRRLLEDPDNLVREVRSHFDQAKDAKPDPLEGLTLRFWDNTPDTLHIVLPPRIGATSKLPKPLKDALRSRTSLPRRLEAHFRDDARDWGDWFDTTNRGNHGMDSPPDS